jgi:PAS domain S-box-containing protein
MPADIPQHASVQDVRPSIFKRSPHPVIIKDEESRFLFLSDAACDLVGVRLEDLVGHTDHDFLPSAEADAIRAIDVEILATGEEKLFEESITARDGSVRTLITHKRRLIWPLANGTTYINIAEIKDVTELRVAEQVLRASEEHHRSLIELHPQTPWVADPDGEIIEVKIVVSRTAEIHEKNAELDRLLQQECEVNALQRRFVAMISHEFRTPLAIIDSAAQRLTRTKAILTTDYIAEKLTQIKSAVSRMVELMESILAAGRLQTGMIEIKKQEASLSAVIEECADRRRQLSPTHRLHLDVEHLPARVCFDREAMERVFSNLFSNAVKYSPAASDILVRGWQEDGNANIEIRDGGIGIDADDLPRLFEPYFRARSATGIAGTGIGLNIVREIVELHGGKISVESAIGTGTTFTVTLPTSSNQSQEKAA